MSRSKLLHASLSGQAHGAGGFGWPKNGHPVRWTLVCPNWSKFLKKSSTWFSLHSARVIGGFWFPRYRKKMFQYRRFSSSGESRERIGTAEAVANEPSSLFGSDLLGLDLSATDAESIIKNLGVLAFWG